MHLAKESQVLIFMVLPHPCAPLLENLAAGMNHCLEPPPLPLRGALQYSRNGTEGHGNEREGTGLINAMGLCGQKQGGCGALFSSGVQDETQDKGMGC